ncbi:hypothetical protein [Caulobacter sp.]|uniref:hypothetical protein n=1 Tax=Caulobacter sp. TaxID=78 RepID=UPI003BAE6D0E
MTPPPARDGGYALVAALMAVLMFAYVAYAVLAADRGAVAGLDASFVRARLEAAADAGLATAVHGLTARDPARRWAIDSRPRELWIDGVRLVIVVEDERGKIPVNRLDRAKARRMFEAAGLQGARLEAATAGFVDWRDGVVRPSGEALNRTARGLRQREGPLRTVGEMAEIPGVDEATAARLAPAMTLFPGDRSTFDVRTAQPLAVKVMTDDGADTPDAIQRAREASGQRTRLQLAERGDYQGRPLTVRVTARDERDGVFHRATVIELTDDRSRPYRVRAVD